jgi:hypothetical protein
MPTPSFCALEEVYGDWDFKKSNQAPNVLQPGNGGQTQPPQPPQISNVQTGQYPQLHPAQHSVADLHVLDNNDGDVYIPNNNGLRSFCPNCQNCVKANDILQQRIIEVNTWPRPRWTPQYPQAYVPFDPYNRYWANTVPQSHIGREDFANLFGGTFEHFGQGSNNGDGGGMNMSTETLLQIILFILIALFIIQFFECLYIRVTSE